MCITVIIAASPAPAQDAVARSSALDAERDGRLGRSVPLEVRGKPLGEVLRALTERSGVRLEAAREVQDLKVTLLVRELPLHRALSEIAALLELTWLRRGAAPGYRYECARSLVATQRARTALEQARAANRASVQSQLARITEAVRKDDTASLAGTDPELAARLNDPNTGPGMRQLFSYLGQMPPEGFQELVRAGRLTTNFDQMPPEAREMVRRGTEAMLPQALANVRGPDGNSPGYESFIQSASYTLGVNGLDYGDNTYYGEMRVGGVSFRFTVDLGIPAATEGVNGQTQVGSLSVTPSPPPAARVPGPFTPSSVRRPLPPVVAVLEGGKPMSVRELADWLAEKTPLAVLSDYYATRYERRTIPVPERADAEAVLSALERYAAMEATVAADDRVLRLRSRRWPLDDLMEPPPVAVEALESALKENGRLGFTEYLLAARLTDAQNAGLGRIDARYTPLANALDGSRPVLGEALRLTASLSPPQRAAAESPAGLPFLQLAPAQRAAVANAAAGPQGAVPLEQLAGAVFKLRREERPQMPGSGPGETYSFTIEMPGRRAVSTSLVIGPAPVRP
jgi:hypothetical protein